MEQAKRPSSSSKIADVVRLHRMIKKWRRLSVGPRNPSATAPAPPRGHLAVCVGPEMQRFVIPTEHLKHGAFAALLREAEEEFGFRHEGALRIPCEVPVFLRILEAVEGGGEDGLRYCSCEVAEVAPAAAAPLVRCADEGARG